MFAADAATYLADFGTATSWTPSTGGATVSDLMIIDQPDDVIGGGDVISRQYLATFATATWPGLKRGEQLVAGGVTYRLRTDPRQAEDGVFSSVALSKVA